MKNAVVVVSLFSSFLMPAMAQERKTNHRVAMTPNAAVGMQPHDASNFWANVDAAGANVPPAPGFVVASSLADDDRYTRVIFFSQDLPAGKACMGWKLITPDRQELKVGPLCLGSEAPWAIGQELFRGSYDWALSGGTYEYRVFLEVNGVMSKVSGYVAVDSTPLQNFTDALVENGAGPNFLAKVTVTGGPYKHPLAWWSDQELDHIQLTPSGFTAQGFPDVAGKPLTVCDDGRCTTRVVYAVKNSQQLVVQ